MVLAFLPVAFPYLHPCGRAPTSASPLVRRPLWACKAAVPSPTPLETPPLTWKCIDSCGACCKIGGYDPDVLADMLPNHTDQKLYQSMVGNDQWCVNFDKSSRSCAVYDDRPWFCRVNVKSFATLYDVVPDQMDTFAAECCTYHINEVYGEESQEMLRFDNQVGAVWDEDHDIDEQMQVHDLDSNEDANTADQPQLGDIDSQCDEELCEIPELSQDAPINLS